MQIVKKIEASRLITIATLAVLIFMIFSFRLFHLQLVQGNILKTRAENNQTRILRVPSYRSIIYDRNKELKLAYNQRSLTLTVIEANLPLKNTLQRIVQFQKMADILNTTPEDLEKLIETEKIDAYTPIMIKDNVGIEIISQFAEKIEEFPGLFWENYPKRVYPFKESGFHIIGYTGLLSPKEYEIHKEKNEYYLGTSIGKRGIEKIYDDIIRGTSGTVVRSVNAFGRVLQQETIKEPEQGSHLVLSVDARLQQKAYDLMKELIGAVIVTKVSTGEVLTLVSTPSVDPAVFDSRQKSLSNFGSLILDPQKPFLNRVIQGHYPPASTFKLISAAAFLKEGINPNQGMQTVGTYAIGNRIFKDWKNHGKIKNVQDAITVSANVYFYHHSQSVGRTAIFNMAREFGLTTPYQIDLPDENPGFLPNDEWFRKTHKRRWSLGDTANIAIGQGDVLTSPLEINMMTAAIANNGTIYKPYILKEKLSIHDKSVIWSYKPTPLKTIGLDSSIFKTIKEGMVDVVENPKGTAYWLKRYNIIKVPIVAKTGTAQTGTLSANNGLFTAYGPRGDENINNAIAVTVLLERNRTGTAVRIAAELFNYYFVDLYPELNPLLKKQG